MIEEGLISASVGLLRSSINSLSSVGTDVQDIITGTDVNSGIGTITASLNGIVESQVIPACQGIGYAISAIFFLISLLQLANQDRMTMEMFIKHFAKLVIPVFFISVCPELFNSLMEFGNGIGELFTNIKMSPNGAMAQMDEGQAKELKNALVALNDKDDDTFNALSFFFEVGLGLGLISSIAGLAIKVACYVITFTRMIELYARAGFLPIAIGLMADDGWHGAGGRFIRKFLAIVSQCGILILIAKLGVYAMQTLTQNVVQQMLASGTTGDTNYLSKLVALIGIGVAMVTAMHKSIGIMNDAFGG